MQVVIPHKMSLPWEESTIFVLWNRKYWLVLLEASSASCDVKQDKTLAISHALISHYTVAQTHIYIYTTLGCYVKHRA